MSKVTFVLNTTATYFAGWLNKHTQAAHYRYFTIGPDERGYISLQSAQLSQPGRIGLTANLVTPSGDNERHLIAEPLGEVIYFDLTPLSADRVQVVGCCDMDAVRKYFHELLWDIAGNYQEAEGMIHAHLNLAAEMDQDYLSLVLTGEVKDNGKRARRKGGPVPTDSEQKKNIIDGWVQVQGKESQENYCARVGVGASTLRAWIRETKLPPS